MARVGIGKRLRFQVLQRDDFRCVYCGNRAPNVVLHVDHVTPVVAGGSTTLGNLVTCCQDCNLGKSDRRLHGRETEKDRVFLAEAFRTGVEFQILDELEFWGAVQNSPALHRLVADIDFAAMMAKIDPVTCANELWFGTPEAAGFLARFVAIGLTGDHAWFVEVQLRERLPECRGCSCTPRSARTKRTIQQAGVHQHNLKLADGDE